MKQSESKKVEKVMHQDFTIGGTGPMVEILTNRMEVTNPGIPLIPSSMHNIGVIIYFIKTKES
jgi:hypothetical protein